MKNLGCLISVVIPAYNAEKTIKRCLESILQTEYLNLEILVIDDGSTDNTRDIVEKIRKYDERVALISQNNQGVSRARNIGIENASGEFIVFIDSDDYLRGNIFEIIDHYKEEKFIMFSLEMNDGLVKHTEDTNHLVNEILYPIDGDYKDFCISAIWSKAYCKNILLSNNLRFDNSLQIGEDSCFNMLYLKCIQKVLCINSTVYVYDTSNISVTRRFNEGFVLCDVNYQNVVNQILKNDNSISDLNITLSRLNGLCRCFFEYYMNANNHNGLKKIIREWKNQKESFAYYYHFKLYKKEVCTIMGKKKFFFLIFAQRTGSIIAGMSFCILRWCRRIIK